MEKSLLITISTLYPGFCYGLEFTEEATFPSFLPSSFIYYVRYFERISLTIDDAHQATSANSKSSTTTDQARS
jgi:hypothetical protein